MIWIIVFPCYLPRFTPSRTKIPYQTWGTLRRIKTFNLNPLFSSEWHFNVYCPNRIRRVCVRLRFIALHGRNLFSPSAVGILERKDRFFVIPLRIITLRPLLDPTLKTLWFLLRNQIMQAIKYKSRNWEFFREFNVLKGRTGICYCKLGLFVTCIFRLLFIFDIVQSDYNLWKL